MNEDKLKEIHEDGRKLALLQIHKAGLDNFAECNKAAYDFLKTALRGTFLINGGAIIAIATAKAVEIYHCYIWFLCGIGFPVIGFLCAHVLYIRKREIWREYFINPPFREEPLKDYEETYISKTRETVSAKNSSYFILLILVAVSLLFFLVGAYHINQSLGILQNISYI